ncbi:MAG: restriction endonuclease [Nitrospirota bacterium]
MEQLKQLYSGLIEEKDPSDRSVSIRPSKSGGHEFEQLVANALNALDFTNTHIVSRAADGGVDIKAEQKTKLGTVLKFYIECKHQPKTAIGRPVVQKLDSAVKAGEADKGMIITSGTFSSQAREYAQKVGIDLIDGSKIKGVLRSTGVDFDAGVAPSQTTPISSRTEVIEAIRNRISQRQIRNCKQIEITSVSIKLEPLYITRYSISSVFSSSVGVIHSVNENSFLITDVEGNVCDEKTHASFLSNIDMLEGEEPVAVKDVKFIMPERYVPVEKLPKIMSEYIRHIYTKTVSYYGNNNVLYNKVCIPAKKDIEIIGIHDILVPYWLIEVKMNGLDYLVVALDLFGKSTITEDASVLCGICKKSSVNGAAICDSCSKVVCSGHTRNCKICNKVICSGCTKTKSRWLIFSDNFCNKCYEEQERQKTVELSKSSGKEEKPIGNLGMVPGKQNAIQYENLKDKTIKLIGNRPRLRRALSGLFHFTFPSSFKWILINFFIAFVAIVIWNSVAESILASKENPLYVLFAIPLLLLVLILIVYIIWFPVYGVSYAVYELVKMIGYKR